MTLLISMCTKNAMYMISDSKIIGEDYEHVSNKKKYLMLKKNNAGITFWGLFKNSEKDFDLDKELTIFQSKIKDNDNVHIISEKLKTHFESLNKLGGEYRLGFHVAGYFDDKPVLKHIFHETWLKKDEFINEDCTLEYHQRVSTDPNIKIIGYKRFEKKDDFPILFNGDNSLPNIILNGIQIYKDYINYWDFSETDAVDFLKFLMSTAINIQKFRAHYRNAGGDIIGTPINLLIIKPTTIVCNRLKV